MDLPPELIDGVLQYLSHPVIATCYKTSSRFHVLSKAMILSILKRQVPCEEQELFHFAEVRHNSNLNFEWVLSQGVLNVFFDHINYEEALDMLIPWLMNRRLFIRWQDWSYIEFKHRLYKYSREAIREMNGRIRMRLRYNRWLKSDST